VPHCLSKAPTVVGKASAPVCGDNTCDDGIVTSEWISDAPGPAKRTYRLTEAGERLLDRWAESLREAQALIGRCLERYERAEGR